MTTILFILLILAILSGFGGATYTRWGGTGPSWGGNGLYSVAVLLLVALLIMWLVPLRAP